MSIKTFDDVKFRSAHGNGVDENGKVLPGQMSLPAAAPTRTFVPATPPDPAAPKVTFDFGREWSFDGINDDGATVLGIVEPWKRE